MKPILLSFGHFHLYSYGLMVATGVLIALLLMLRRARQDGFPTTNDVYDLVFVTLLTGFLGARTFYVIQNFNWYSANPGKILAFWEGGLIFYGGLIGSFLGVCFFLKAKRISLGRGFDFLMPFIALAHAFGRIGCFLNGCCYGKVCDLPWAVTFPHLSFPVHPTQLYEAAYNFFLFLFLYRRYPQRKFVGEISALYFSGYAIGRFLIEFWRADNPIWNGLTSNHWVSIAILSVVLPFIFYQRGSSTRAT